MYLSSAQKNGANGVATGNPNIRPQREKPGTGTSHGLGLDDAVTPRRTGLQFPARLPFSSWAHIGHQLSLIADSSAWWLGDWLVYGEKAYEKRYKHAIERTALDYQTLRNYAWVARRFPLSRRRDRLTFAHHAEAAALPEREQDIWLQRAEHFGWSRNQLRRELRSRARSHPPAAGPAEGPISGELADQGTDRVTEALRITVTAERRRRWECAAARQSRSLEEWVVQALDCASLEGGRRALPAQAARLTAL